MEPKSLQENILKSNFKKARDTIQENNLILNPKLVVKLVNSCYTVVCTSECKNVCYNDLYELLRCIVEIIESPPTEKYLDCYLQSVYYILEAIIKKGSFDVALKLEMIILPHFLPDILTSRQKSVFRSSYRLLYEVLCKSDVSFKEFALPLCQMITKLSKISEEVDNVLNRAYNCSIALSSIGVDVSVQEKFYFFALQQIVLGEAKVVFKEEVYTSLVIYFTYIINNYLRNNEFNNASEFYQKALQLNEENFSTKTYNNLFGVLEFFVVLSPIQAKKAEILTRCWTASRYLGKYPRVVQITKQKSLKLLQTIVYYYKYDKENGAKFAEFNTQLQLKLCNFLLNGLGSLSGEIPCNCPNNCGLNSPVYEPICFSMYCNNLLSLNFITNKSSQILEDFKLLVLRFLKKSCKNIQKLKIANCQHWEKAWQQIGHACFNIGTNFYKQNDPFCLQYYQTFLKYHLLLETGEKLDKLKEQAFIGICEHYHQQKNYENSLVMAALALCLNPGKFEFFFNRYWIDSKRQIRQASTSNDSDCIDETSPIVVNEQLQELTLVTALELYRDELFPICDTQTLLSDSQKEQLLISELEQYKQLWPSKMIMFFTFTQLQLRANLATCAKVIAQIFGDCNLKVDEKMPAIFRQILVEYEEETRGNTDCQTCVNLAVLYHLHYKYCVKDAVSENCEEMERTRALLEPPSNENTRKDPNEECDIISSYESLKLSRFFPILKFLNSSLTTIESLVNSDSFSTTPAEYLKILFKLLMKIAFEYRLHRHSVCSLHALQLALRVAEFQADIANSLHAISFLLEKSDLSKSGVKKMFAKADGWLEVLMGENQDDVKKIILTYYLCKIKAFFYHDYVEAFRIFKKADDLYEKMGVNGGFRAIKAQLLVLHFAFVNLPCNLELEDHQEHTIGKMHLANSIIFEEFKNLKAEDPYELSVLFDVNEALVKLYCNMGMPREVRCYCKDITYLSQKIVLPLRCASNLMYLALSDLKTCKFDDCQVKLTGVADILCLPKSKTDEHLNEEVLLHDEAIDFLSNQMQEMMRDVPVTNFPTQFSSASPTLSQAPYKLPSFVKHVSSCDCFSCTCVEYQVLVLAKTHLDATINYYRGNLLVSKDFFHGGFQLYEILLRNFACYQDKIQTLVSTDLLRNFECYFLEIYGRLSWEYCNYLANANQKPAALQTNGKILGMVSKNSLELPYLYNELLLQRLGFIVTIRSPNIENEKLSIPDDKSTELSVTPESKSSKVTITVTKSSPDFTTYKKLGKKFRLDMVDSDEEVKTSPSVLPKKAATAKTPANNIKIYSKGGGTTGRKKKPQEQEQTSSKGSVVKKETTATKIKIFSRGVSTTVEKNKEFSAPVSNIFCTPNKNGVELKSRTKLLTERLKEKCDDVKKNAVESKSSTVRTGSQSEKLYGASSSSSGAIRRSARNLK